MEYPDENQSLELLEQLVGAIAANIQAKSPVWYHDELEKAAIGGWLLSTSEQDLRRYAIYSVLST